MAGFRFVTVLSQRSDISCWDYLVPELKRHKLFFSTKIYCGSLSRVYFLREAFFLQEYPSFELKCGAALGCNLVVPMEPTLRARIPNEFLFVETMGGLGVQYTLLPDQELITDMVLRIVRE
jgi:hypothetical protein